MAFGIYVHIPYCIQRCSYCDFATYEKSSILPPSDYIEFVRKEIQVYGPLLNNRKVDTVYFGGGTPSLIEPLLLNSVLTEFRDIGLNLDPEAEVTMEINPATLTEGTLNEYLQAGFNRFSVGAQTFDDELLVRVGRKHGSNDTRETLSLLDRYGLNYTFDLLFALPGQSLDSLQKDLEIISDFAPRHLSAYCLTVPDGHPLARVRLPEHEQVEMFQVIEGHLGQMGLDRYEISNFAQPGWESRHNLIYWTDEDYWGVGLSAHSYIKDSAWGNRFWNDRSIKEYVEKIGALSEKNAETWTDFREIDQYEALTVHQSLTDYCHTFLRTMRGLSLDALASKFGGARRSQLESILNGLESRGWVQKKEAMWSLTADGVLLSNQVFEACTFLD